MTQKHPSGAPGAPVNGVRAHQDYGALRAEIHIAGYSFERAAARLLRMLKNGDWRRVGFGDDVNAFIGSLQLDHLRASAEQRKQFVELVKKLQPEVSNRRLAKAIGVHESTVRADIAGNPAPVTENTNKVKEGKSAAAEYSALSGAEAAKVAQRHEVKLAATEQAVQRREASRNAMVIPDGMDYRIGDCRKVLADVPVNSVPLILTDPPFRDEAERLYQWLAEFAARVLIPGGSLICFLGKSHLDRRLAALSKELRFWWLCSRPYTARKRFPGRFVISGFRPVVWYVKGYRRGRSMMPDVLDSLGPDPANDVKPTAAEAKELHDWGQGEGGVWQVIEHLTEPGELIVDPFAGTGEWGEIAISMGRRWLGSDVVKGGIEEVHATDFDDDEDAA